jgi:hypothetical protein
MVSAQLGRVLGLELTLAHQASKAESYHNSVSPRAVPLSCLSVCLFQATAYEISIMYSVRTESTLFMLFMQTSFSIR